MPDIKLLAYCTATRCVLLFTICVTMKVIFFMFNCIFFDIFSATFVSYVGAYE